MSVLRYRPQKTRTFWGWASNPTTLWGRLCGEFNPKALFFNPKNKTLTKSEYCGCIKLKILSFSSNCKWSTQEHVLDPRKNVKNFFCNWRRFATCRWCSPSNRIDTHDNIMQYPHLTWPVGQLLWHSHVKRYYKYMFVHAWQYL